MKKHICLFLLTCLLQLFSKETNPGFIKNVTDPSNGRIYSNIRSDSLNRSFYEVIFDRDLLYEKPDKNSEITGYLSKNSLVELLEKGDDDKFYKIRMQNESGSLKEGWSRRKSLSKDKYYGRSLITKVDSVMRKQLLFSLENEINPQWILEDNTVVYADSGQTVSLIVMQTGNQVFVHSIYGEIAKICYKISKFKYQFGYIKSKSLSPFALIKGDSKIETLLEDFDLGVLENDLVKSGFVNYLTLETSDDYREEFVEDKLCRERKNDTVSYKRSFSNNLKKIDKFFTVKGRKNGHNFAFFRYLPDEKVRIGLDSLLCKVVELVYKPKTALITVDGIEAGSINNQTCRLTIFHLDKFNTDIVFHRQDDFYNWKFKWSKKENRYLEKSYKNLTRNKRLVRMDLEKK